MDPALLNRYPFLPQAKEQLASLAVGEVGFEAIVRAKERAIDSVNLNRTPSLSDDAVSYALARILMHLVDSDFQWNRFAKGEAQRAASRLRTETPTDRLEVARCIFPSLVQTEDDGFEVSMLDFLTTGGDLPKSQVDNGKVRLNGEGLYSLFRKAVFKKARAPIVLPQNSPVKDSFAREAEELRNELPKPPVQAEYKGQYLSLPCVQNAINHTPEGKRYYASLSICIACKKDGLSRDAATQVLETFVNNSGKTNHPFTMGEAVSTLEWVYKKDLNFSCKMQRAHGLAPADICGPPCVLDIARAQTLRLVGSAARRTE